MCVVNELKDYVRRKFLCHFLVLRCHALVVWYVMLLQIIIEIKAAMVQDRKRSAACIYCIKTNQSLSHFGDIYVTLLHWCAITWFTIFHTCEFLYFELQWLPSELLANSTRSGKKNSWHSILIFSFRKSPNAFQKNNNILIKIH